MLFQIFAADTETPPSFIATSIILTTKDPTGLLVLSRFSLKYRLLLDFIAGSRAIVE